MDGAPLEVPIGWERLLVDAAVIGGRDRWARRLRGLRAEFDAQLRALENEDDLPTSNVAFNSWNVWNISRYL